MGCCCNGTCKCGLGGGASFGSTMSLNVSGMNIPTTCLQNMWSIACPNFRGVTVFLKLTTMPLSGTFCLSKEADVCRWSVTVPCVVDTWMGPSTFFCTTSNFLVGQGCDHYSNGCFYAQYTQLKIEASANWVSGIGSKIKVRATVDDADAAFRALIAAEHPPWDGYDPFVLIDTDYETIDCAGSATINSNSAKWYDLYQRSMIDQPGEGCISADRIIPPSGNSYNGTQIISDSAC